MTAHDGEKQWVWLARIRHPQGRKGEVFADILTDFPEKFAERKELWLIADPESARAKASSGPTKGTGLKSEGLNGESLKGEGLKGTGLKGEGLKGTGLKGEGLKGTGFSPYIESAPGGGALAPAGAAPELPQKVELQAHWLHKGGIVLHFAESDSISDAETLKGLIVAIPLAHRAPLAEDEVYIGDLIGCTLFDVAGHSPVEVGKIEQVDRTAGPVALLVVVSEGAKDEILIPFAKSYLRRIDLAAKRVEMALPEGLLDLNAPGNTAGALTETPAVSKLHSP
ncbi:MAG: ribosome maturation factor RimM [Terracidiphilus sp.]